MKKNDRITRRQFLKGLLSGAAGLAAFRFLGPSALATEGEDVVYINDLIHGDDTIEARFLNTPNNAKSDATILLCHGRDRLQVLLVDGGLANGRCYVVLTQLRSSLMQALGLGDKVKDRNYKLRLTLVATHCHKDHVAELYANIIPSKMMSIESLYVPAASALTQDGTYNNAKNGDMGHRSSLLAAMARYAPDAPVHIMDYGETAEFGLACGSAKIYAPLQDWGVGDALQYVHDVYYPGAGGAKIRDDVPVAVVNANCQWLRVTLGEHSLLFPGDIMKKRDARHDEPMDLMVAAYADELKSDVVKYPHHGISRNQAAVLVYEQLMKEGGTTVLSTAGARDSSGVRLKALGANFVTTEDGSYTFYLSDSGVKYEQV